MTQPQPPPQPSQGQQNQALALTVASALAGTYTVAGAAAVLVPVLAAYKIRREVIENALEIVMGHPPDAEGFHGPAGAQVARLNLMRRAQFLVASISRLHGDYLRIRAGGAGAGAWREALARERRFYGQHLAAGWGRTRAAAQVDSASMQFGRLLGWHAVIDSRTSPECLWASRRNFHADQMPRFGYPGMVHPACRCWPGVPFPGAPLIGAARVPDRGRPVPDHRPRRPVPALSGHR